MAENPYIGVAVPPLVNLSFSHFGHAWYANRPMTKDLVHRLGLEAHLDSDTPIAIYGTMFWFRPKALRKLFEHKWEWSEFNPEPHHVDGGLAHALERLTCYAAQDAGYITYQILNADSAAQNYSSVEYKLQKVQSYLDAGEFKYYHDLLGRWRASGYPTTAASSVNIPQPYYRTVRSSARELWYAIKRSVAHRCPKLLAAYRLVRHFRSQLSMQRNS
jgi:rhamnosyltransferase